MIFKTRGGQSLSVRVSEVVEAWVEDHSGNGAGWHVAYGLRCKPGPGYIKLNTEEEAMAALVAIDASFGEPVVSAWRTL